LLAVVLHVRLGRLRRVMRCLQPVPMRSVRVMGRLLVSPRLVVLRRFLVMTGGVLEVFGGLLVMFRSLLRHGVLLCLRRGVPSGPARVLADACVPRDGERCSMARSRFGRVPAGLRSSGQERPGPGPGSRSGQAVGSRTGNLDDRDSAAALATSWNRARGRGTGLQR